LDVPADAVAIDNLAQQNRPAISELRNERPVLVASVGHREGGGALRYPVACEDRNALRRGKGSGVKIEVRRELFVQPYKTRRRDAHRSEPRIEALRELRIAVVEGKQRKSPASVQADAASRYPLASEQDKHKSEAGNQDWHPERPQAGEIRRSFKATRGADIKNDQACIADKQKDRDWPSICLLPQPAAAALVPGACSYYG
jgi:hypothetical protein